MKTYQILSVAFLSGSAIANTWQDTALRKKDKPRQDTSKQSHSKENPPMRDTVNYFPVPQDKTRIQNMNNNDSLRIGSGGIKTTKPKGSKQEQPK